MSEAADRAPAAIVMVVTWAAGLPLLLRGQLE